MQQVWIIVGHRWYHEVMDEEEYIESVWKTEIGAKSYQKKLESRRDPGDPTHYTIEKWAVLE